MFTALWRAHWFVSEKYELFANVNYLFGHTLIRKQNVYRYFTDSEKTMDVVLYSFRTVRSSAHINIPNMQYIIFL